MTTSLRDIPSAFAPFYQTQFISEHSIPLSSWPLEIYGGRQMYQHLGRVELSELPKVYLPTKRELV